jgi:hypothetical protein
MRLFGRHAEEGRGAVWRSKRKKKTRSVAELLGHGRIILYSSEGRMSEI